MSTNGSKFPDDKAMLIREQLKKIDDEKFASIQTTALKNPTTLLIISILVGWAGVDRFMLGQTGMGILKLFTGGGFLILYVIDLFTVQKQTKELNYKKMTDVLLTLHAF